MPIEESIDAFITKRRPDVVMVTPLVAMGSTQAEYVRSARALGIPTALCVASWDNLTNKGLIHASRRPGDRLERGDEGRGDHPARRSGAERRRHGRAAVRSGWFEWQPSVGRALNSAARLVFPTIVLYILYACSSRFIAPEEVPFGTVVAAASPRGNRASCHACVLVRPHPQNAEQWRHVDLADTVRPSSGRRRAQPRRATRTAAPTTSTRSFHSAAVVGINTTAEIESSHRGAHDPHRPR